MQSFPALLKKPGTVERGDCVDVMPAAVADTFNARRKGQPRPLLDRQSVHVVSNADGRPIMHPTDQCAHTRLHIKGLQLYAELLQPLLQKGGRPVLVKGQLRMPVQLPSVCDHRFFQRLDFISQIHFQILTFLFPCLLLLSEFDKIIWMQARALRPERQS